MYLVIYTHVNCFFFQHRGSKVSKVLNSTSGHQLFWLTLSPILPAVVGHVICCKFFAHLWHVSRCWWPINTFNCWLQPRTTLLSNKMPNFHKINTPQSLKTHWKNMENVRLACLHISKAPWRTSGEFLPAVRESKMYQICSLLPWNSK